MKYLLILLVFWSVRSFASQFHGYAEMNQTVRERLIDSQSKFQLGSLINQVDDGFNPTLLDLTGSYKGFGLGGGFRNGQPNAINMLIWKMIFEQFSNQIAGVCLGINFQDLNSDFTTEVKSLCDKNITEEKLQNFWMTIMNYDAPESEYIVWRDQFMTDEWKNAPANDLLWAMSYSIFMNPYFLLKD